MAVVATCAPAARAGLPGLPVEQWRWTGPDESPMFPWPATTPLVVQLTEDNGDGLIDACDVPDILFLHFGRADFDHAAATALDGLTGAVHFTVTAPRFGLGRDGTAIAAGDVDADGIAEILVTDGPNLIALEHDGTHAWTRAWPAPRAPPALSIGLADLDQDGRVEIYSAATVLSAGGGLAWAGTAATRNVLLTSFSHAADLDPTSSGMELLFGNSLYSATGTTLWTNADGSTGGTGIGDVDGDGDPEIVLVSSNPRALFILDIDGTTLGPGTPLPGGNQPSAPLVADLDGDGRSEIVVQVNTAVEAFEWNGAGTSRIWVAPGGDSSCCGGVSGYDFDGDGMVEVVYRDENDWYVVNGPDGAVLHQEAFASATGTETPTVADIDNDGLAEILVNGFLSAGTNANSLVVYEVPASVRPRPIWNQQGYHATNVRDDATVPRLELPAWEPAQLSWGAQVEGGACCPVVASPWPSDATICAGDEAVLDGSGVDLPDCPDEPSYSWLDESGTIVGTDAVLRASPADSALYRLVVECASDPTCVAHVAVRVEVHVPPVVGPVVVTDPSPCNLGLLVEWEPAVFQGAAGGVYHVHRTEPGTGLTCADALALPPVAIGLPGSSWIDSSTIPGVPYLYVVRAEDAIAPTACPDPGPSFGGATASSCLAAPIMDEGVAGGPEGVGTVLFVSHVGDDLSLDWATARALLPGERFVLRKTRTSPTAAFMELGSGDESFRALSDRDLGDRRQFFELRVADPCGTLSADEYPAGS